MKDGELYEGSSSTQVNTNAPTSDTDIVVVDDGPTTDLDSLLPQAGSGPSTPTNRGRSSFNLPTSAISPPGSNSAGGHIHDFGSENFDPTRTIRARPSMPRLRRAVTSIATPAYHPPSSATSTSTHHRRRPTLGSASLHVSPSYPQTPIPSSAASSNPVSPTPSLRRRRLRGPSLTSTAAAVGNLGLGLIGVAHHNNSIDHHMGSGEHSSMVNLSMSMKKPTTRNRSASHSDIFHLVEGYVEGGAANETVVYAPGGTVKSVGVLGEEDEGEEEEDEQQEEEHQDVFGR